MTVKPLTKEQKLEILSKAIDAGAHIQMHFHTAEANGTATPDEAKVILRELEVASNYRFSESRRNEEDYKFEGIIYLPVKQTASEWQDTGDMEEANA